VKDKEGQNLLAHLSNVLTKVLLDDPKNAYDVFEDYSHSVKLTKYDFKKHDEFQDNSARLREKYADVKEVFQANKKLLDVKKRAQYVRIRNSIILFCFQKAINGRRRR